MRKSRFTDEQIIAVLHDWDEEISESKCVGGLLTTDGSEHHRDPDTTATHVACL
jgi:hypothetical protein